MFRVIVPPVGGAFGGKTEATPASILACIFSRKLGRPVKITYERPEVFYQNKGRHPCHMKLKLGFDAAGNIIAVDFDNLLDGGAHSSWGFVTLWFTAALLQLPYKMPNVRFRGRRVFTNKPTTGAQRCLGGVQVRFCVETLMDEGIQHAVLGASGCGAFMNPAHRIAKLYRQEIEKRKHRFRVIAFAIYQAGYGPDNLTPFEDVFSGQLLLG